MDYSRYVDISYFALTLLYALVVLGWHRIRELMPVSLISIIVVGIVNVMGINLRLFQYNKPFLDIFGIPLFHLLWVGVIGIVFIHYMKPRFSHNLLILVYSTALFQGLAYVSDLAGEFNPLGNYNYYYNSLIDFSALAVILLFSETLYKFRIYDINGMK